MRDIGSHAGRRPPPGRKPWEAAVPVAQANRQWANRCGRRKSLTMSRIARGFPPTRPMARRIARAISMGHYQRSLVLAATSATIVSPFGAVVQEIHAGGCRRMAVQRAPDRRQKSPRKPHGVKWANLKGGRYYPGRPALRRA